MLKNKTGYSQKHKLFASIYYDINHPAGFSSIDKLFKYANQIDNNVTKTDVKNWLLGDITYTLHHNAGRNFLINKVIVKEINEQWEADLADLQQYKRYNNNYKYILTIIDCFSKFAYAYPLKDKSSISIVNVFKDIFKHSIPEKIHTDNGKEFVNSEFKKLMKNYNIVHFTSKNNEIKCSVVERFNRTLKSKMFKYFTHVGNYKYVNILDKFVNAYNHTVHRSIKMRPVAVKSYEKEVFYNLYGHSNERDLLKSYIKPVLSVGDSVRIKYELTNFDKKYHPNWTDQIFVINKVIIKHHKPLYELKTEHDDILKKKFYPEEILKINNSSTYRVDKIIKSKIIDNKKYLYVKWFNYPDKYNSWIRAEDYNDGR